MEEELEHWAILGPLQEKPINLCISHFVIMVKPDSDIVLSSAWIPIFC